MFERTSSRLMACESQDDFRSEPARGDSSVEGEVIRNPSRVAHIKNEENLTPKPKAMLGA
jgi:hypothetical protein